MEFEEITKENSFWKLFRLTRKIKTAKDTLYVFLVCFAALLAFYSSQSESLKDVELSIISSTESLMTASISLVGFIFAAYVLYASMTDKELMRVMALNKHPDYDMSFLKYGHCNFIKIILDLLMLVTVAYLANVIFPTLPDYNALTNGTAKAIYIFLLSVFQAGFVLVLMLCKSAIFNVYHSIMMSTRWYAEEKERQTKGTKEQ